MILNAAKWSKPLSELNRGPKGTLLILCFVAFADRPMMGKGGRFGGWPESMEGSRSDLDGFAEAMAGRKFGWFWSQSTRLPIPDREGRWGMVRFGQRHS